MERQIVGHIYKSIHILIADTKTKQTNAPAFLIQRIA